MRINMFIEVSLSLSLVELCSLMSGTVSHVLHLLFGGRCGISSAVWMVYLYLWLPILCSSGDLFFSLNNPQRNGLSLVGIAGQIQVLTKYSFLAVWKTVFFPERGLATPVIRVANGE